MDPVDVRGQQVRPIDMTSRLLFDAWKMPADERDLTVMRVELVGTERDQKVKWTFDLLDFFDEESGIHSMARTTGYTATLVARMVLDGSFDRPGINPPEFVGASVGCYEQLLQGYKARGINISAKRTVLDS